MKIHSDTLTTTDVQRAFNSAQALGKIGASAFLSIDPAGSRSHARSWKIRLLAADHDRPDNKTGRRRWTNTGKRGAGSDANGYGDLSVSYAEHGYFMALVLAVDPLAWIAHYRGASDFERATRGEFPVSDSARATVEIRVDESHANGGLLFESEWRNFRLSWTGGPYAELSLISGADTVRANEPFEAVHMSGKRVESAGELARILDDKRAELRNTYPSLVSA
jgi:hypothetical protein